MDMVLPEASKCQLLMLLFLIVRFGTFKSSGPSLTGSTRITMWRSAVWTRPTCTSGCGSRPSPGTRRTWTYTPSTTSTTASPSSGTPYPRPMPGLVTSPNYLLLIFFLNCAQYPKAKQSKTWRHLCFFAVPEGQSFWPLKTPVTGKDWETNRWKERKIKMSDEGTLMCPPSK